MSVLEALPRRLEKFLRDATNLSVNEGRLAHAMGRVQVHINHAARASPLAIDDLVYADDRVLLDGQPLTLRTQHQTLAFNKPLAVTSTLRDPLGQRDLTAWLEQMPSGVFPVGRLDRDTTGLLLCTNDGDLANAILHPDHHTHKLYWLWLNEHIADDDPRLAQLTQGVMLKDYCARAVEVRIQDRTDSCTELLVTLREGKNRQIRRMCRALNFYLHHLHRKAIGPIGVDSLAVGSFRTLQPDEVDALWCATGGRRRAEHRKLTALWRRARERRQAGRPEPRLECWLEQHSRVSDPPATGPARSG